MLELNLGNVVLKKPLKTLKTLETLKVKNNSQVCTHLQGVNLRHFKEHLAAAQGGGPSANNFELQFLGRHPKFLEEGQGDRPQGVHSKVLGVIRYT